MFLGVYWLNPRKANVFGCILELPCLSGRLSVCPTVNKILVSVKALAGGGRGLLTLSQTMGVLRGSVVKCLTRNPGVLGSCCTGSSGFFVAVSLGKTLQSPSLLLVKPRKDMNKVCCRCDMTEILLKAA